ncbi:putative inactive receptor kinase [Arachis hypogaea]|nr:putative inactive receptor kinase [Arachis hypogaea]
MRSEPSITSLESGITLSTSTLVVLSSRVSKALRFEDLLRAPAELIGRGMHGSLYKVMLVNGVFLAVKRIKDWGISKSDFQRRIGKVSQVNHPFVLPPLAYYCSR